MSRSKKMRDQRRVVRGAAFSAVRTLTDEELKNLANELGRLMSAKAAEITELRARLDAVKTERERRRTVTSAGIHVSDHAVLRYLERVRGVDMQAIREEITALAGRAVRMTPGQTGTRRDDITGIVLGVNEDTEHVTTVYRDAEVPVVTMVAPRNPRTPTMGGKRG